MREYGFAFAIMDKGVRIVAHAIFVLPGVLLKEFVVPEHGGTIFVHPREVLLKK